MRSSGCTLVLSSLLLGGAARADVMTFQDGVSPSVGYVGTRDVALVNDALNAGDRNATNRDNEVDSLPLQKGVLVQWDVSAIPAGSTVTAVRVVVRISNESDNDFFFYECLRPWVHNQATWLEAQTGVSWTEGGANSVGSDRGGTALGTLTGPLGSANVDLNATGVAVVQQWINTPSTNHGFLVQNYVTGSNGLDFNNSADATASTRPLLRITHSGGTVTQFQNGVAPTGAYAGNSDTTIINAPLFGGNANAFGLMFGNYPDSTSLLQFDLSPLPPGARINAAALDFYAMDPSPQLATVSETLVPWTETGATWRTTDGATLWQTPGAAGALDHGATPLGTATTLFGPGSLTFNAQGVQLIDDWVHGLKPNLGFFIDNNSGDDAMFLTREDPTLASRPSLTLTYVVEPLPDGGSGSDGGTSDGGTSDGGTGGGTGDGGSGQDGGGGGSGVDGGPGADGGDPLPLDLPHRNLEVGCGCGTGGGALLSVLLAFTALASWRRRPR